MQKNGQMLPKVSIVVPVYNTEEYLVRCLDSLISQTFKDIEIIAVDDGSTDGSLGILEKYKERYPEKFIVRTIPHIHGAGAPRNIAFELARGDYFAFCDSDDIMDIRAVEALYAKAIQEDLDIVCAPIWLVTGHDKVIYGVLQEPLTTETLILNGQVYLCNKLIHKRLIKKAGQMPENMSTEDLGYSLILHSYAKKIGYIDLPVYYYMRRYGSDSNTVFAISNLDTIRARKYAIKNCNPQYSEYVLAYIARHINSDLRKRWLFTDKYIQHLKELWGHLQNNRVLQEDDYLYDRLKTYVNLPDNPIPRNVYVSGFGGDIPYDYIETIKEKAFYDGCNVIILNEKNCDYTTNEIIFSAYNCGKYEFVSNYFALKNIIESGGIYLDRRIIIDLPFNYIRYCRAFFSLLDEQNISEWVFGGMAKNEIMINIFNSYNKTSFEPNNEFMSLSERVRFVLEQYKIPLSAVNNMLGYPVTIFSPDVMVCDITDKLSLQSEPHICTHDYTDKAKDQNYITIKKSTLRALVRIPGANDELNEVKKENSMLRNKLRNIELSSNQENEKV